MLNKNNITENNSASEWLWGNVQMFNHLLTNRKCHSEYPKWPFQKAIGCSCCTTEHDSRWCLVNGLIHKVVDLHLQVNTQRLKLCLLTFKIYWHIYTALEFFSKLNEPVLCNWLWRSCDIKANIDVTTDFKMSYSLSSPLQATELCATFTWHNHGETNQCS